jgi:hypothetical protein
MDFAQGSDSIRLTNSGFADFAALQAAMTTVAGTHTLITFATGATLQIHNILPGQLQASDFEFTAAAEPLTAKAEVSEVLPSAPEQAFDFSGLRGAGGIGGDLQDGLAWGPSALLPLDLLTGGLAEAALLPHGDSAVLFALQTQDALEWAGG